MQLDDFLLWLGTQGVPEAHLPVYRAGARAVLDELEDPSRTVLPRHVDQAIRKADNARQSAVYLANLKKVGDMLVRYAKETAVAAAPPPPEPAPAPAPGPAPRPPSAAPPPPMQAAAPPPASAKERQFLDGAPQVFNYESTMDGDGPSYKKLLIGLLVGGVVVFGAMLKCTGNMQEGNEKSYEDVQAKVQKMSEEELQSELERVAKRKDLNNYKMQLQQELQARRMGTVRSRAELMRKRAQDTIDQGAERNERRADDLQQAAGE